MFDVLKNFYNTVSIIDLIYLFITILSLVSCYKKGFVLSILSMAKWLLAYVITLIMFPKIKPYVSNIIDNEYVLDIGLGIIIFVCVIFLVLLVLVRYFAKLLSTIEYKIIDSLCFSASDKILRIWFSVLVKE